MNIFLGLERSSEQQFKQQIQKMENAGQNGTLQNLIQVDPILAQYFSTNVKEGQSQEWKLAHSLMLDGIRYRTLLTSQSPKNFVEPEFNPDLQKTAKFSQFPQHHNTAPKDFVEREKQRQKNNKKATQDNWTHSPPNNLNPKKQKHYNVAYIKHNRFLSPSQKKQYITPKVTETIPKSPNSKIHIYGKPRVRTDQNYGCPYHETEEDCLQSIPYAHMPCSPPKQFCYEDEEGRKYERKQQMHEIHVRDAQLEARKSKSPPTLHAPTIMQETNPQKYQIGKPTIKEKTFNKGKSKNWEERQGTHDSTIYVDNILSVKARSPGMVRFVNSPKHSITRYEQSDEDSGFYLTAKNQGNRNNKKRENDNQVQSKIKFLIQRDKKNKALEKNMKKQEQRLRKLEAAMEIEKKKSGKPDRKKSEKSSMELSDSSMSLLDANIAEQIRNKSDSQRLKVKIMAESVSGSEGEEGEDCSCSQTFKGDDKGQSDQESSFGEYRPN